MLDFVCIRTDCYHGSEFRVYWPEGFSPDGNVNGEYWYYDGKGSYYVRPGNEREFVSAVEMAGHPVLADARFWTCYRGETVC